MNRKSAEMALIYRALMRAVRSVYEDWGIECQESDLPRVVLRSGHVRVMIRDELRRAPGEKKEALYREIGSEFNLSRSMVEKIALGQR